jgi:hypothetical protein
MLKPQLEETATALTGNTYIDTLGYAHLRVLMITGFLDETIGSTAATTALYLEECDTTDGSYASLSSTPGAVLGDYIRATDDEKIFCLDLDLRGRKRYIEVNAPTSGNGTTGVNICIIGILSKAQIHPDSASEGGFEDWVAV